MWFDRSRENVLADLSVDPARGLSEQEVLKRLERHGPNKLEGKKPKTLLQIFLGQLKDWLIYVLLSAVVITLLMGEYVDAIIILLVVFINASLGVFQELKAGKAIEALQKLTSPKALVRRDGEIREIESSNLVPGDILILDAGRFIAADLRLLESANLQIEESALTGESVPSNKDASQVHSGDNTPLGDRANSAFMSTLVTHGRGVGVVVETGMKTEVGKIAKIIDTAEEGRTPLEIRLEELGKVLGKLAVGICALLFIIAFFQGRPLAEMFLTSVSLAVAAIPEGLAAIVAVVLSIGVTAMSKRNAIIKRLPAVETLGSVNIVCSDKTGTLTQNKMTVTHHYTLEGEGQVERGKENATPVDVQTLAQTMALCVDATFDNGEGTGDPTEIALLMFCDDLAIDRKALLASHPRKDEKAFDSDRKLMSTLVQYENSLRVCSKGALGSVLEVCTHVLDKGQAVPLSAQHREQFEKAAEALSDQALRTLAAAFKQVDSPISVDAMEQNLTLVGLVGMIDPPREEAKEAIQTAKQAGITPIMITGDHRNTAFAIAQELGIAENLDQAIEGQDLDSISDEELQKKVEHTRVFARVSPQHKVRIVHALKANGYIVAMTGDGVNDAPSLNAADIGIAMGVTGTDVAKSASDMILADDNFATIISAIEQGRNIYNNIRKSVIFLLTSNLGEVVAMMSCILAGWPIPLLATQILWINLLTDSLPAIALGMDPGDKDVMNEKPRDPKESFFAGGAGLRAIAGGIMVGSLTIAAFWIGYKIHGFSPLDNKVPKEVLDYARTLAFLTLIACQLFYAPAFRSTRKSIFQIGFFSNRYLTGAIALGVLFQGLILAIPATRKAFNLRVPDLQDIALVLLLGMVPLALNEISKLIRRWKH